MQYKNSYLRDEKFSKNDVFFLFKTVLKLAAVYIFFHHQPSVKATVFSTIADMESLLHTQSIVIQDFNLHITDLPKDMRSKAEKFKARCESEHSIAMKNVTRYLENPINSFVLVKRMSDDLYNAEKHLTMYTPYQRRSNLKYANSTDLEVACQVIIILIIMYDLNVSDLANGTLIGNFSESEEKFVEYVTPMTPDDCFRLAQTAYRNKEYEIGLVWAKEAHNKVKQVPSANYQEELVLIRFISEAYYLLNDIHNSIAWVEKAKTLPLNEEEIAECDAAISTLWQTLSQQQMQQILETGTKMPYYAKKQAEEQRPLREMFDDNEKELCHGVDFDPSSSLYCEYQWGPHPFLRLARLKAELLHQDPQVTMLHDVISDREIEVIKNLTKTQKLKTVNGGILLRHTTCFEVSWSKVVADLTVRALDFTGQARVMQRKTKYVDYGIGGFQAVHFDGTHIKNNRSQYVNANATVLYYLSNVNQGGATIFPELELTVFPKKNAALVWNTEETNGISRMFHASCPVLHGTKIIITEWFSEPNLPMDFVENICEGNGTKCRGGDIFDVCHTFTPISYDILNNLKFS